MRINKKNLNYLEHVHYPAGTPEYDKYISQFGWNLSVTYWEHFSFRPSVHKCSVWKDIGLFYKTSHFERAWAREYIKRGYISTFLDTIACMHIGKRTWEKTPNAYNLNETSQFVVGGEDLSINVISSNSNKTNQWREFKKQARHNLLYYDRVIANNLNIPDEDKYIYNNMKLTGDMVNEMIFHSNVWKSMRTKYAMILKDTVKLKSNFQNKIENTLKLFENGHDIIFLGKFGYIISKTGADKILEYVKVHGYNKMIWDYLTKCECLKIHHLEPSIITSPPKVEVKYNEEWVDYHFYRGLDSCGNDIKYLSGLSKEELKKLSDDDDKCNGFNTLGWIKHTIVPKEKFCTLYGKKNLDDGLYVKK